MNMLETQAQFESMWFDTNSDRRWVVYFTASWCKPCQQLDMQTIQHAAEEKGLDFWKCDASVNDYTAGYAGVRKFPTFVYYMPGKELGRCASNNTETVQSWIQSL